MPLKPRFNLLAGFARVAEPLKHTLIDETLVDHETLSTGTIAMRRSGWSAGRLPIA